MAGHDYEKVSLLPDEEDEARAEQGSRYFSSRVTWSSNHRIVLAAQALLLIINIVVLAWNVSSKSSNREPFSPASSAVSYSIQQTDMYAMNASHFIGEPRLELDQAWSDLLRSTNIRISESEMRRMNKTSVALRDGSGYLGYLEVHHMLHCLKRFKQFRHLEHYPELDRTTFDIHHWDHCIEVIRQGLMCNADLMIDTLAWKDQEMTLQGVNRWPRKCADWDSVQAFADSRAVQVDHYAPLENFWPREDERSIGPVDLVP